MSAYVPVRFLYRPMPRHFEPVRPNLPHLPETQILRDCIWGSGYVNKSFGIRTVRGISLSQNGLGHRCYLCRPNFGKNHNIFVLDAIGNRDDCVNLWPTLLTKTNPVVICRVRPCLTHEPRGMRLAINPSIDISCHRTLRVHRVNASVRELHIDMLGSVRN